MSHRIIEKRRRDRMNNCLADLSRLVPTNYLKKGRGRIEKTEIIEMAIKHLKHLQAHPCHDPANCEIAQTTEKDHAKQFTMGFHDCLNETIRYMADCEGLFPNEGPCYRLVQHLRNYFAKVYGKFNGSHSPSRLPSDDKASIQMEVDCHSNSCFSSDHRSNGELTTDTIYGNCTPFNNRVPEVTELKQEVETNGHLQIPLAPSPVKVTSQLREMLQNPGVPKDTARTNNFASISKAPSPLPVLVVVPPSTQIESSAKTEEVCYKFKNTIKHRFNADLRHHTTSDGQFSEKMEEDHNNNRINMVEHYPLKPSPINQAKTPDERSGICKTPDERLGHNGMCKSPVNQTGLNGNSKPNDRMLLNGVCNTQEERLGHNGLCSSDSFIGHAFSPYPTNHPAAELVVKIPDRSVVHPADNMPLSSSYNATQWDSHAETASSSGSDSSPPPVAARSNGSSSGYSTNGENNSGPSVLKSSNGAHSPGLSTSSYSRTPDRMSNGSPSPHLPPVGVPIFALHPKGTFYIPLTVESSLLIPYLAGTDDLAPVLHPISICVNLSSHSLKVEKPNDSTLQYRSQSTFLMDKFHDRFVYPEKSLFYPCPTSPQRNGCT